MREAVRKPSTSLAAKRSSSSLPAVRCKQDGAGGSAVKPGAMVVKSFRTCTVDVEALQAFRSPHPLPGSEPGRGESDVGDGQQRLLTHNAPVEGLLLIETRPQQPWHRAAVPGLGDGARGQAGAGLGWPRGAPTAGATGTTPVAWLGARNAAAAAGRSRRALTRRERGGEGVEAGARSSAEQA